MEVPHLKELRRAYGFDEVAIVPGDVTVNPDQTNIDFTLGDFSFSIPFLASSLDAVASPEFAICLGKLGGLAVLNLEGIYTRYDDPESAIQRIIEVPQEQATSLLQKIYSTPVKENLIGERTEEIKKAGVPCAVSITPANSVSFPVVLSTSRARSCLRVLADLSADRSASSRGGSGAADSLLTTSSSPASSGVSPSVISGGTQGAGRE